MRVPFQAVLKLRDLLEGVQRRDTVVVIARQEDHGRVVAVLDVVQRRDGMNEVKVGGNVRVAVVCSPGGADCEAVESEREGVA